MKALPLLLIGGAAVVLLSGKKRRRSSGPSSQVIEEGVFPAGELWRLVKLPSAPDMRGGDAYMIESDLKMMGEWITFQSDSMAMIFGSMEEAREMIRKIADGDLLVDEYGVVSA